MNWKYLYDTLLYKIINYIHNHFLREEICKDTKGDS